MHSVWDPQNYVVQLSLWGSEFSWFIRIKFFLKQDFYSQVLYFYNIRENGCFVNCIKDVSYWYLRYYNFSENMIFI